MGGLQITEAHGLFRLLDIDNSGQVSIAEFVLGCLRLRGSARNVDVATLLYENKRMMHAISGMTSMLVAEVRSIQSLETRILKGKSDSRILLSRKATAIGSGTPPGRREGLVTTGRTDI